MKWPSPRTAQIAPVGISSGCYDVPGSSKPEVLSPSSPRNGPRAMDLRTSSQIRPFPLSFIQTFGKLGIPVVLMILVSIAWTSWLIVLTVAPNEAANYLMGTAEFDDGNFWMIIDPEPVFMTVSVVCLGALVISYINVVIKMTVRRNSKCTRSLIYRLLAARFYRMSSKVSPRFQLAQKTFALWKELNDFEGSRRKIFNAFHKSLDLAVQLASLYRLLEEGVPTKLCYVYACLVAINSFSCAAFILLPSLHSAFFEVFVDTMFDMLFAVGWPIFWLWYSYEGFEFDRAKAHLNVVMYPAAWFERQARRSANSSEATLFLISFDALRMKSGFDLCLRMAMNVSFSLRLSRVVDFMIRRRRQRERTPSKLLVVREQRKQAHIRRPAGLIFVLVSISVLVHTNQCITLSNKMCAPFPECAAYAYRWSDTNNSCPCRALIDVEKEPPSYEEWMNPIDGMDVMRKLAESGDLRVIEVINRHIPMLPDELQGSSELRSIILSYTGIQVVPDWAASFTNLEYLIIEGRANDRNLVQLPHLLFDRMQSLTFLHLGVHQNLRQLPSLTRPTNLKTFSLALLLSLKEIPTLVTLSKLQRVLVVGSIVLERFPDLSPSVHLVTLGVLDVRACCDGYIGVCNPDHYLCSSVPSCLDKNDPINQPNAVTKQLLDSIAVHTCQATAKAVDFFVDPSKQDIETCAGVLYRQCVTQDGTRGMCYSSRMQVVACQTVGLHEEVRKSEIQQGIGRPCDVDVEQWLGCSPDVSPFWNNRPKCRPKLAEIPKMCQS